MRTINSSGGEDRSHRIHLTEYARLGLAWLMLGSVAAAGVLLAERPVSSAASTAPHIRVGLLREIERVTVLSDYPMVLLAGSTINRRIEPGAYQFVASPAGIEAAGIGRFEGAVRLVPTAGGRLFIAIRPYRGQLELRPTPSGRLTVINEVDLEEYLYGVLKMEVDPAWPAAALRAQAIAARTLALHSLNRFSAEGYDVRATTDTQVYGGVIAEDPRATTAVDATRGEIMTYQGQPILAVYHSDSGGFTESSEFVWGETYPYLRGVPDPYSTGAPKHEWVETVGLGDFEDRLRHSGRPVSGVTGVEVAEVTPSGRAQMVRITGAHGVLVIKGTELRTLLGAERLRSTLFTVRLVAGEQPMVEFQGRGYGHGVGLSQWGARGMAEAARTHDEILAYYYSGIAFETR